MNDERGIRSGAGAGPRTLTALAVLVLVAAASGRAQQPGPRMDCESGDRGWFRWQGGRRAHVCEVREQTLAATGELAVDAGPNGGVRVAGWNRDDVLVRAEVRSWGDDEEEAREIARQVEVLTDGTIRSNGPRRGFRNSSWSVSYEVFTPRDTDVRLDAHNGGIVIEDVRGDIDFDTTNGGVRLSGLAGDVRGSTTNGGFDITLTGSAWDGRGLDVSATNGGVSLHVPDGYSARLRARTVNGGVHVDFPVTVRGRIGRALETTLGEGGAPIEVETTNGGVHVTSF